MNVKTVTETAQLLGCSKQYIHNLIAMRKIQAERAGHQWLIPDEEVERLIEKRRGK